MGYFIYENRKIEYVLSRKKVKNINLRIKPDCTVTVSAPLKAPQVSIDEFIYSNAARIASAIDRFSQRAAAQPQFVSGDIVPVLGIGRRLSIVHAEKRGYRLSGDSLDLYCDEHAGGEIKKQLYENVLRDAAKSVFPALLEECRGPFKGVCADTPQLKIRKMKLQWGNCRSARNIITLNYRLAAFAPEVIRFVIYHEYCHFLHPDHSRQFYSVLEKVVPDWKKYDKILKNSVF